MIELGRLGLGGGIDFDLKPRRSRNLTDNSGRILLEQSLAVAVLRSGAKPSPLLLPAPARPPSADCKNHFRWLAGWPAAGASCRFHFRLHFA